MNNDQELDIKNSLSQYPVILVVDDEESVRSTASRILNRFGYKVYLAKDHKEAVLLFTEHHHTIASVLLDVVMPEKNGRDTAEAMATINPNVPIILNSGYPHDIQMEGIVAGNIVCYLPKPYSPSSLMEAVAQAVKLRES